MKVDINSLNIFQKTADCRTNNGEKKNSAFLKIPYGSFANLAPLKCDTVSFGRKKTVGEEYSETNDSKPVTKKSSSSDKRIDHVERASLRTTIGIYDESYEAFDKLKYILQNTFSDVKVIDMDDERAERMITSELQDNKDKPVVLITARRKDPVSISEKMAQMHLRSKKAAKENINDLIGARIIVSGTSTKEGEYVLEELLKTVQKKSPFFKIKKVKVHNQENSELSYARKGKLDKFVKENRKINGETSCEYIDQPRDSGYLAIHLITDEIADGYSSEIQIMGLDVANFKELEDICYKCNANKRVPKKYKPIKDMFEPYKKNKAFRENFLEYTKRAYAYERLKPIHEKDEYLECLPIPKDIDISQDFDFNNLNNIKRKIDRDTQN